MSSQDTTAGAMSSLVYYLAKHSQFQARAREEVLAALGHSAEPDIENLRKMPFTLACIRESLRINTPIVSAPLILLKPLNFLFAIDVYGAPCLILRRGGPWLQQ
jgi:cytochrome P450